MKVYELMKELSEQPAGAEVSIYGYLSEDEIKKATQATEVDTDKTVYKQLSFSVKAVEYVDENSIIIDI